VFLAIEPSRKSGLLTSLAHFLALGLTWYRRRRRQTAGMRVDILHMRRDLLLYWHDACNQPPTAYEKCHRISEQIVDRSTLENDVEHGDEEYNSIRLDQSIAES